MERQPLDIIADQLDTLQRVRAKELGYEGETISHVEYIISDLRKGDLEAAKRDYAQQSDKFGSLKEIEQFLVEHGIAEKIDFNSYK